MRAIPTGPRSTPLDPLRAGAALEEAFDREEIFELLLRAARSRLEFAALLLIQPGSLRGWRVLAAPGYPTNGVETIELPRTVPAFETAIAVTSPSVGPLATGEQFVDGMLELLGGRTSCALVLPICVRMHALALVVGHRGEAVFTPSAIADLFPLVDAADAALARVLSTRARSAAERAPSRAETAAEYELEIVDDLDTAERRQHLAVHRAAEAWPLLAELIRELVRDGVDHGDPGEDEQLELLLELGRVEAEKLGRPEAAIVAWRSAQTIDGSDDRVLDALEGLFAKQGRWLECVELLDKRAALAEESGPRTMMLLNLAAIAREHLGDPGRAIEAYERIVAAEPGHPIAAAQLEQLYAARHEWEPLAAQMLDRASREPDLAASLAALADVAEVYEHKVGDARAALLVLLTLLRRDPQRPQLLDEIARLAAAAAAWDEVVAEATSTAEALEAAHSVVAIALWQQIGRWSRDRLADRDAAVRAFERALGLEPADAERASELNAELAELHEAMPALAIEYYAAALAGRPEHTPILVALHRLYLATQAWEELAELVPRLIDALAPATTVAVIVDLHVELGSVLADHLDRADLAVGAFQDALALDPKHAEALRRIAVVYEATGQAEALLEVTEAEIDAATPEIQARRYGDIAAAWHEHGRFDRAAAAWHKLLASDPRSAAGQQGLARTLRADGQWLELVGALRAQVVFSPGGYDRLVLLELAEVLETRLDDVSGATAVLEEITAREPADPPALDALARLHDRAGRLRPALDALDALLPQVTDSRARADLFQRVGQVHLAARDAAAARASLVQSLALDKDNPRAREAMARVHLQQGELVAAGEELLRAARLHATREDILRCLADAAWLYRHRLADTERARECLHRILEIDPAHGDAKHALAELMHDNQEWESLWPHLEAQVAAARRNDALPAAERTELYTKAARCAVELGKFPVAMELYELALGIAPNPAILIERAEALYRSTSLEAAAMSFQTVATTANLERAQRIAVYRRLAQIQTELGRTQAAQQSHNKVLDLDPANADSLAELAELHLAAGRYDDAIANLRSLGEAVPAKRPALLEQIGDLYRHQLENPVRATSTYLDALDLDAGNRRVLQRLLDLQSAEKQWTRAVETIGKFLDHETDRSRRGAYHLARAEIRRTELRDNTGALDDYELGLDELLAEEPLKPATRQRALAVFHQIEVILTPEKDWKALEQSYRRMIKRMPAGDPAMIALWHALGELCRSRLEHVQSAIQAFEVAHSLDPDKSPMRARILTDLYAKIGATEPVAKLVETAPTSPEAYRALVTSSRAAGNIDEAWCAARALVVLKHANFEEELLYRKYQPHEVKKAKGVLDEAAWQQIRHPDEDRVLSAIFAIVWDSLVALRAGSLKSFDLRPKERLPIEEDPRVVAKIFRHAARLMNVALPDVYAQPRRPGGLLLANCVDKGHLAPAVIMGRDMMTGYRDTQIAFAVGAMLALLRPSYYLKLTMSTVEELEAAIAAAALLVGKQVGRPELEPLVSVFAPAIKAGLTRPTAETLLALVERLPDQLDLARWRTTVDATAQRCGLLVSGELAAATRVTPDLVAWSVSPGYFAIRAQLGVAVR